MALYRKLIPIVIAILLATTMTFVGVTPAGAVGSGVFDVARSLVFVNDRVAFFAEFLF